MAWPFWDRLRVFFKSQHLYTGENIFQNQSDINKYIFGNQFFNFKQTQSLIQQTNLQINRLERYKDYTQMDEVGEIFLSLDLYSDEASMQDPERKHVISIKAKSKALLKELENFFYNTLLIDNKLRPMLRYLCKFGDFAAEIIPTKNRDAVANFRFMNVYNFTRVETKYGDLVGFFYQDEFATSPVFLHPWQVMHLRLTSYENIFHPYGRCQKFGTRVLTPFGYKNIEDFHEGDEVCVYDDGKIVNTKVVAACHSGEKEILKIKSKHFTNECSGNHPILIRSWEKKSFKFGEKWFSKLIYKRADELEIGDELVVPKIHNNNDYKVLGDVDGQVIKADEDFARLFGFLIGDGWLKKVYGKNHSVCFACGVDENQNNYYAELLGKYSPNKISENKRKNTDSSLPIQEMYTNSVALANFVEDDCNFIQGCKNKRIPQWVYSSPRSVQIAFIEGLVDADGSVFTDKWDCNRYQIELSNYDLVKDVKMLLHSINWKCGNIIKRKRKMGTTVIRGVEYNRVDSWLLYFYKSDSFIQANSSSKFRGTSGACRKKECAKYNKDVMFEAVVSIEKSGIHPTADIQVEHPASNFIADGIVVHNSILDSSRKSFKQLRLMEDAAIIYRLTRAPERRVFTIPVGNISPKEVPDYIQEIAATLKKRRIFDPATGEVNEMWSPLIQEDDYFLPQRPDGSGPKVDTLPGAQNLDQIADIEYFKKKMVLGLKIPLSRVGIGEGSGEDQQRQPLAATSPEFAKAIQWIQREVAIGLKKIAMVHLALRGYDVDDLKHFDVVLTSASAIDELYRMETWNTRVDVIGGLKETGMFPDDWILTSFTNLTDDDIIRMQDEMSKKGVEEDAEEAGLAGLEGELAGEEEAAESKEAKLPATLESNEQEKMMLQEYNEFKHRSQMQYSHITNEEDVNSGLSNALASNELSGIPIKSEDNNVILESSINKEDIITAAEEARSILLEKNEEEINARLEVICELFEADKNKSLDVLLEEVDAKTKAREQIINEEDVNQSTNGS